GDLVADTYKRNEPLEFPLGKGYVIRGIDIGVSGMRVNEKRHINIPSYFGYDEVGCGNLPPHSPIICDVELISIE
ncbi:FKBP-type peptidyl-prolyl cis-trans isomerase, partial [bacterium]|nr:FKBP-type peptidyl-prolyl cis-trans isomerase [bacterium]